jgi:hypothetical protein
VKKTSLSFLFKKETKRNQRTLSSFLFNQKRSKRKSSSQQNATDTFWHDCQRSGLLGCWQDKMTKNNCRARGFLDVRGIDIDGE